MSHLNSLVGGLFIITVFGILAIRQVIGCLRLFVIQSILLAASACIVGYQHASIHLFIVAGITIGFKAFLIPWLIYKILNHEIQARREIEQVLNIPTSLLIAVSIAVFTYFTVRPLLEYTSTSLIRINLSVGMAGLLLGAYAITVRREALPQLLGILTMENGAFLAGISIAPNLPLIVEVAAAFDVLIIALVMGLLTRRIHKEVGTTLVGEMATLKEE
jgi:hydrogenase-4 component E